MRDQPTGDQLLETARDLLRDELLPNLPASHKHGALMIANAMGIALRQLKAGDEPERRELADLRRLLALCESDQGPAAASLPEALAHANRALCQLVRSGGADAGEVHDKVWAHLMATTRHRVSISNPKYLEGKG